MTTLAPFDASKYLDNEETIAELLCAALEDPDIFVSALAAIAKARGMTQIARESGLGRESLYKALAPGCGDMIPIASSLPHAPDISGRYPQVVTLQLQSKSVTVITESSWHELRALSALILRTCCTGRAGRWAPPDQRGVRYG